MTLEKSNNKAVNAFLSLSGILGVLIIWDLAVRFTGADLLIPRPSIVFSKLFDSFVNPIGKFTLIQHALFSLKRVLVGFSLSAVCGIMIGILIGRSKFMEAVIRPIFELIRPIPGVAWIPMAILWFGIGESAKHFIIFMGGFSHLVVNTYSGTRRVDKELLGVAYMLGATERKTFFNVVLPSCVPYIFAGLQVSLSTSWMAVLAAEMVSATEGTGWIITAAMETGDMVQILVGIVVIAVIGLLLSVIIRFVERVLCRWREKGV